MRGSQKRPMKLLRRWRDHDWTSRLYFLAAFLHLLAAYWRFRTWSVVAILADLEAPPTLASKSTSFDWRKAGWAIEAAAAYAPWRSDCLIRAMAAASWLRRHGYRPHFHLGVAPHDAARPRLSAHAWLSMEGEVIVGGSAEDITRFAAFVASSAPKN